jgi:hypothetical protein
MKGDGKIMEMKIKAILEDSKMLFNQKMKELKILKNQNEQLFESLIGCSCSKEWENFVKGNKKNIENYIGR